MIPLKFDRNLSSTAAQVLVILQYNNSNTQFHGFETSQVLTNKNSYCLVNKGPLHKQGNCISLR